MMSKKLRNDSNLNTSEIGEYIISDYGYGKDNVKL